MAGRPQRKAPPKRVRKAPAAPPARRPLRATPEVLEPLDGPPVVARPGTYDRSLSRGTREARDVAPAVRLSVSYARALDATVTPAEAVNPDAVVDALVRQSAARNGGRVRLDDAIAAAMLGRSINCTARDGVSAAKELADRTEGPVVQRVETASVRYVVSVTPGGGVGQASGGPLTLEEWESQVREAEVRELPAGQGEAK